MEFLLGGLSALGAASAGVLGFLLYKSGRDNRSDLHKLVQAIKDLSDAKRDLQAVKNINETIDHALKRKESELERSRNALAAAEGALSRVYKKLASSGHSSDVATDINDILGALHGMPKVPPVSGTTSTEDDNG